MKILCFAFIASQLALSQAMPRYDGYFDNEGYYHRSQNEVAKAAADYSSYKHRLATSQNEAGQSLCTSATYGEGRFEHYLHICKEGEGYCYFTDGPCCTFSPGSSGPSPIASFDLTIDSFSAVVNYYSAKKDENCYELDTPQPGNLDYCTGCDPPTCTDPICQDNTVLESCDSEGTCTCKTGFAPDDCCECDFQNRNNEGFFYEDPTGECQKICLGFCATTPTIDGCSRCQEGYKGPSCCECADDYYFNQRDQTCRAPCDNNFELCTDGVCLCKPGYLQPDCCQCAPDYYKSGTECKAPCEGAESCSNGVCTCMRGYQGPGCCECQPGFYKDNRDGKCKEPCEPGAFRCINGQCQCEAGYTGEGCCECDKNYFRSSDGTCKAPCDPGFRSCSNGQCQCEAGYTGDDCCECDKDYYENPDGSCEEPCDPGFRSCTNGQCSCDPGYTGTKCCKCDSGYYRAADNTCKRPCDGAISCQNGECECKAGFNGAGCCQKVECVSIPQDIYFVIDTTSSYGKRQFCELHYGTELLMRGLNPGGSLEDTRVSAVLYPKTDRVNGNFEAKPLFPMGAGCEQSVGIVATLLDGFYNEKEPSGHTRPYSEFQGGRETVPGPAIEYVTKSIRESLRRGEPSSRERIVVIMTDGANSKDPEKEIEDLERERATSLVVGYNKTIRDQKSFRAGLTKMAGDIEDNVIINDNPVKLMTAVIERLVAIGAMCSEEADKVKMTLGNSANLNSYCFCVVARSKGSHLCTNRNIGNCPSDPDTCRSPPKCPGQTNKKNEWYIGSPNYNCYGNPGGQCPSSRLSNIQFQPEEEKEVLEQEILAAVEEVLNQRKNSKQ